MRVLLKQKLFLLVFLLHSGCENKKPPRAVGDNLLKLNSEVRDGELGSKQEATEHEYRGERESLAGSGLQPTAVPTVTRKIKQPSEQNDGVVIELPTGIISDDPHPKRKVVGEPKKKKRKFVEQKLAQKEKKTEKSESVLSLFAKKAPIIAKAVKDMLPIRKDPAEDIKNDEIKNSRSTRVKEKARIHKSRGFGGAYGLYKLAESFARKKEVGKAKSLYLSSCQNGYAPACHRYGWHLDKSGNKPNANRFYKLACDRGVLKSCNNLGWNEESKGQHLSARIYYDMACKQNHRSACKNLKRLNNSGKIGH